MNSQQIRAALAEREELASLVAARNDAALAHILSAGRVRVRQPHMIGEGTVSDAIGLPSGPLFVRSLRIAAEAPLPADATVEQQAQKALIEQAWRLLQDGRLDIGLPSVRTAITQLAAAGSLPGLTPAGATALLALAEEPDPISVGAVSDALNEA